MGKSNSASLDDLIAIGQKAIAEEQALWLSALELEAKEQRWQERKAIDLLASHLPEAVQGHLVFRYWIGSNTIPDGMVAWLSIGDMAPILIRCEMEYFGRAFVDCRPVVREAAFWVAQWEAVDTEGDEGWLPSPTRGEPYEDICMALAHAKELGSNLDDVQAQCVFLNGAPAFGKGRSVVVMKTAEEKLVEALRQVIREEASRGGE